jgi:hypothetical protein
MHTQTKQKQKHTDSRCPRVNECSPDRAAAGRPCRLPGEEVDEGLSALWSRRAVSNPSRLHTNIHDAPPPHCLRAQWLKYWVVLRGSNMFFFRSPDTQDRRELLGHLHIETDHVVAGNGRKNAYEFYVTALSVRRARPLWFVSDWLFACVRVRACVCACGGSAAK